VQERKPSFEREAELEWEIVGGSDVGEFGLGGELLASGHIESLAVHRYGNEFGTDGFEGPQGPDVAGVFHSDFVAWIQTRRETKFRLCRVPEKTIT